LKFPYPSISSLLFLSPPLLWLVQSRFHTLYLYIYLLLHVISASNCGHRILLKLHISTHSAAFASFKDQPHHLHLTDILISQPGLSHHRQNACLTIHEAQALPERVHLHHSVIKTLAVSQVTCSEHAVTGAASLTVAHQPHRPQHQIEPARLLDHAAANLCLFELQLFQEHFEERPDPKCLVSTETSIFRAARRLQGRSHRGRGLLWCLYEDDSRGAPVEAELDADATDLYQSSALPPRIS